MDEISDFSCCDTDENSTISGIKEHTLQLNVNLNKTSSTFSRFALPLENNSKRVFKKFKRSSSSDDKNTHSALQRGNSLCDISEIEKDSFIKTMKHMKEFKSPNRNKGPGLPKSNNSHAYKAITKKFEENFNQEMEKFEKSTEITKQQLISILFSLHFLTESTETPEISDLYKLFLKCPTQTYLKSLLQGILKIKDELNILTNEEIIEIRDRFPSLYSNYFKSKKKSFIIEQPNFSPRMKATVTYKIITKQTANYEKSNNHSENLYLYQHTLDEKIERTSEKINKERYKECTFKPIINKKSKAIDSSPSSLRLKNSNSYISLKESRQLSERTEVLYEFAEIARNRKQVNFI